MRHAAMTEEPKISRQQKVMAAKAAFGQNSSGGAGERRAYRPFGAGVGADTPALVSSRDTENYWQRREMPSSEEEWQFNRGFGLLRFMAAAMLLLVLVTAFHQGFSYKGFDRAYVQERLNDETAWNQLEKQVQQVYLSLEKQWKK